MFQAFKVPFRSEWRFWLPALCLLLLDLCVALSLYSFDVHDPSLNQTNQQTPHNLLGLVGGYVADLLYQLLGLGSWLLVCLVAVAAWRMACGIRPYLGGWTSWLWLPVLLAGLGLLHLHEPVNPWLPAGLGGAFGVLLSQWLLASLPLWAVHTVLTAVLLLGLTVLARFPASMLRQRHVLRALFRKHQHQQVLILNK